ncbi:MAG: threonylcarbamoyl-AMP synthase [Bacteroidales bacterium]|jgi:L-threonylcarbamoyladenylate synthase|nr:threonylcarbamoyl-AMP synthase [Bacteroidales bacterium]
MEKEITKCIELLLAGKVILYPTDTIWGIGCDATNENALEQIYRIKQRYESKSMIILLDKSDKLPLYVQKIPLIAWDLLNITNRPTTYIYPTACNLPKKLIHSDGTIAIRIVNDPFCSQLIRCLGRPVISTSANLSGEKPPASFADISPKIIKAMDYCVPKQYASSIDYKPSRLIKFINDYNFAVVRE